METDKLIKQLDKWIEQAENMPDLPLYWQGQAQALWNVKQFIEVNKIICTTATTTE